MLSRYYDSHREGHAARAYDGAMSLPRRWLGVMIFSIASLFAIFVLSYISILIAQEVSARRASKMLDDLEAIKIGDPASTLEKAVPQCALSQSRDEYRCATLAVGEWYWQRFYLASYPPNTTCLPFGG